MRSPSTFIAALALIVVTAPASIAGQAAAKPAPKLPAAIETAFKAAYPAATIKGISREKYAGKDAYEVESVDNGKTRDLIYLLDGTVVVVEEEVSAGDLPAAVVAAMKADFPKATVTRYERLVTRGVTTYEMQLKGAKVGEAEYTVEGKRK